MPPFVLTVLKVAFLLLLYFFVYRAIRTVAADLSVRRAPRDRRADRRADRRSERPAREPRQPRRQRGGVPSKVVVLDQKGGKLASHRLDGEIRIGRSDTCEITLQDTYASQQHARISERNGGWVVEDLGSTNGTYLNRQKVTVPTELAPGDRIRIGNTYLELRK